MSTNPLLTYITTNKQDAAVYKAKKLHAAAGDDIHQQTEAIAQIKTMLACIDDEILLEFYTKHIAMHIGIPQKSLSKAVKGAQDAEKRKTEDTFVAEGNRPYPSWVDEDRINILGFDWKIDTVHTENTGMYFHMGRGWVQQLTNFLMKPIVQIISDDEMNRRKITEINNGRNSHVFELPSAAFTSAVKFETLLLDQGYYLFKDGFAQSHLNKLKSHFLSQYPLGYEITNLGWQDEGFFAFSNVIYHNGIKKFDEYGLADVDGTKYLSMGSSNILKNLRKGTDSYKNDKYLHYQPSVIPFKAWTKIMMEVYDQKAMMGVAWCLLAINRDIVSSRTNYCPIPYCFGAAASGKSQFVGSLTALFTKGQKPINLNQVSIYAFWEYTGRFKNVLMAYNEFDVQSLPEPITKAFKGMADGEGRVRGTGRKNKSETQEVNCVPVLLGQYLATIDDGAILSRSIPEKFIEIKDRPQEKIDKFNELKDFEAAGLSGLLIDILAHRSLIADEYTNAYAEVSSELKADFAKDNFTPKNRVVENYTVVLALMKLYQTRLEFAFTYEDFYAYCKKQILNLNNLIGESNSLGEFWKMLESLSDSGDIESGWDYKIETVTELRSMIANKTSSNVISFAKPTRLLFLRLKSVFPVYAKEKRNVSGKAAIPEDTIKSYLIDQPYYVGASSNANFKSRKQDIKKGTSSMVLNYDMLMNDGVNLLEQEEEDPRVQVTIDGHIMQNATVQSLWNTDKVSFTLLKDESTFKDQVMHEKKTYTKCLWADISTVKDLKLGAEVKITGLLSTRMWKGKQYRDLEVQQLEIIRAVPKDDTTISLLEKAFNDFDGPATGTQLNLEEQLDKAQEDKANGDDEDLPF